MQRNKRQRLSNEGPIEVFSSGSAGVGFTECAALATTCSQAPVPRVLDTSAGCKGKQPFSVLHVGNGRRGLAVATAFEGTGPGSGAAQQNLQHTALAVAHGAGQIQGPLTSSAANAAFVVATGRRAVPMPETFHGARPGASPLKPAQAQRRVWVREGLQPATTIAHGSAIAAGQPAAAATSATPLVRFPNAAPPLPELIAMRRRLQRQGRFVAEDMASVFGVNSAMNSARPLGALAGATAAPAASASAETTVLVGALAQRRVWVRHADAPSAAAPTATAATAAPAAASRPCGTDLAAAAAASGFTVAVGPSGHRAASASTATPRMAPASATVAANINIITNVNIGKTSAGAIATTNMVTMFKDKKKDTGGGDIGGNGMPAVGVGVRSSIAGTPGRLQAPAVLPAARAWPAAAPPAARTAATTLPALSFAVPANITGVPSHPRRPASHPPLETATTTTMMIADTKTTAATMATAVAMTAPRAPDPAQAQPAQGPAALAPSFPATATAQRAVPSLSPSTAAAAPAAAALRYAYGTADVPAAAVIGGVARGATAQATSGAAAAAARASMGRAQYLRPGKHKLVRKAASTVPGGPNEARLVLKAASIVPARTFGAAGGTASGSRAARHLQMPTAEAAQTGVPPARAADMGAAVPSVQRPQLRAVPSVQRAQLQAVTRRPSSVGAAAAAVAAAAATSRPAALAAAIAARHRAVARLRGSTQRRGQLTWCRGAGNSAPAAITAASAATGSASRRAAGATAATAAVHPVSASISMAPGASGAAVPTCSVTSPAGGSVGGQGAGKRPQQTPVLLRVGRSKLRPAAAPAAAVAAAAAAAAATASMQSGSSASTSALGIAGGRTARHRPRPLLIGVMKTQLLRKRTGAVAGEMGAVRLGVRSLKLVTVNGQQYYAAQNGGGGAGGGGGSAGQQLHSLGSIAGKAAAAAAAAAAVAAAKRRPPLITTTTATPRVAMASRAVRKAVWRRRGLDPTSPTANAAAAAVRRRSLTGALLPVAASSAAARAGAGAGAATVAAVAAAAARARMLARTGGSAGGRAAAAQRILAQARMRRAAAAAIKERGYCPEYSRTGVCSMSRNPSAGRCPHTHDPSKVAVCARWLTGSCIAPDCHLQHRRLPDLMPLCAYFLQGKCTAADCPYLHKAYVADAPVCRAFLHSYCPRGAACPALHLTAKMARDRARLQTAAGVGRRGKRLVSDDGSGAADNAGEADAASVLEEPTFEGVHLRAPKRRRGGFRYFDAEPEEVNLQVPFPGASRETASTGSKAREAAHGGPVPALVLAASGGVHAAVAQGTGGAPRAGAAGAAGKEGSEDGGGERSHTLLPGGFMLFL